MASTHHRFWFLRVQILSTSTFTLHNTNVFRDVGVEMTQIDKVNLKKGSFLDLMEKISPILDNVRCLIYTSLTYISLNYISLTCWGFVGDNVEGMWLML